MGLAPDEHADYAGKKHHRHDPVPHNRKPDNIGLACLLGGPCITVCSGGSKAKAIANATELTMFTHRIGNGVNGKVSPTITATSSV